MCEAPAVGSPVAAGAYERRTPFLAAIPFLKGGNIMSRSWIFTEGCQGNKAHLGFKYLQPLLEPTDSFPNTVLFQLIKINDTVVMPLPFEVTTEAGRRLAERVSSEFTKSGNEIKHTWVAGNANGYFGYTTTPEEYARQNYEGGHTLYGQYSTPYLAAQLGKLAKDLNENGEIVEVLPSWDYELKVNEFFPEVVAATGDRLVLEQPGIYFSESDNEENYISFEWLDVGPSHINLHDPLLQVEVLRDGKWHGMMNGVEPINDEGYDLEVRIEDDEDKGMAAYQARWYNPVAGGEYRFVIEEREGQAVLYSKAFNIDAEAVANHSEQAVLLTN